MAFAVGVFIAFSPTYGLHTLSALFCAWAFRLNVIALFAGSLINNPWTFVPILAATFWTGFQLTGTPDMPPLVWHDMDTSSLYQYVMPYFLPFFLGGAALSLGGSALAYPAAFAIISRYRTHGRSATGERLPDQSS